MNNKFLKRKHRKANLIEKRKRKEFLVKNPKLSVNVNRFPCSNLEKTWYRMWRMYDREGIMSREITKSSALLKAMREYELDEVTAIEFENGCDKVAAENYEQIMDMELFWRSIMEMEHDPNFLDKIREEIV